MPVSEKRRAAFLRNAERARRAVTATERRTLREIALLLREARAELLARLGLASASGLDAEGRPILNYSTARDLELLRAADATAAEVERALASTVRTAERGVVVTALDAAVRDFEIAGIKDAPFGLLQRVPFAPLVVAQSRATGEMISAVSDAFRRDTRRALSLALAGQNTLAEVEDRIGRALPGPGPFGSTARRASAIVRTELGRTFELARDAQREEVEDAGFKVIRRWTTAGDLRVRPSHAALDGVACGPGEFFNVGGHEAEFPKDPSLPPEEAIACRCTVAEEIEVPADAPLPSGNPLPRGLAVTVA